MQKYVYNPRETSSNETKANKKEESKKSSRQSQQSQAKPGENCFCLSKAKKPGTVINRQLENLILQRKLYTEAVEREKALYDPHYAFSYSYQSQFGGRAPQYQQQKYLENTPHFEEQESQFEEQPPTSNRDSSSYQQGKHFNRNITQNYYYWNHPQYYTQVKAEGHTKNSPPLFQGQFEEDKALASNEHLYPNYQEYKKEQTNRPQNEFQSKNRLDSHSQQPLLPSCTYNNLLADTPVEQQADVYKFEQVNYLDFKKKNGRIANQQPVDTSIQNGQSKAHRQLETQLLSSLDANPEPKLVEALNPNKIADLSLLGCSSDSFQGIIKYVCWKEKYGFFQITSEEGVPDVFFHFDDFVLSGIMVELIVKFKKLNIIFDFDRLHYFGQQKMRIKAVNLRISSKQASRTQATQVLGPPQRAESKEPQPITQLKKSNNQVLEKAEQNNKPLNFQESKDTQDQSISMPTTKDTNDSSSN